MSQSSKWYSGLLARIAVVSGKSDLAALSIKRVRAIDVVQAAAEAEPVLGWLDLLHVETTDVVSGENAERIGRNTIVALSTGIELATFVGRIETAEMGRIDAARDLTNGFAVFTLVLDVFGVGEEICWELALVGFIPSASSSAVRLSAAALSDSDISVSVARRDHTHVGERIKLDDIVGAVLELVEVRNSTGNAGNDEGEDGRGAHCEE